MDETNPMTVADVAAILDAQDAVGDDSTPATQEEDVTEAPVPDEESNEDELAELDGEEAEEDDTDDAGEEDADEGEVEEQEDEERKLPNGETVTLKELEAGYMKDSDYRRKTAEVAEKRKQTEASQKRFDEGLNVLANQLEVAQELANTVNVTHEQMSALLEKDPNEYLRVKAYVEGEQAKVSQIQEKLKQVRGAQQARQKEQLESFAEEQRKIAFEKMPDLEKPKALNKVREYAKGYGLTDQELDGIVHNAFLQIAEKARRYDEGMSGAKKKVARNKAKVLKGGAASNPANAEKLESKRLIERAKGGDLTAIGALL